MKPSFPLFFCRKDRDGFLIVSAIYAAAGLVSCSSAPLQSETSNASQPAGPATAEVAKAPAAPPPGASSEASAEYHFALAQAYVAEGNPDRAIEEFKLVLMYDQNSALIHARLATEYIKKGMLSAAMESCKEALRRDPQFLDARLILAGLYSTSHENDSALSEYDRVLKQDPRHEEAAVYKSQVLLEMGQAVAATKVLRDFAKKNPDSVLAWYHLARAEQAANRYPEAATAYEKTLELRPNFTQAGLALGYMHEERGKTAQAMATYSALYEETQDMMAANRMATLLLKEEKYEKAAVYLTAIRNSDPEDLNVRVKLGLIQMQLKQYDTAISTFKEILARSPSSDRVLYYLGSLYEETKQSELAIETLKKIEPDSKLYSDAVLHVGFLLKQAKRVEDANTLIAQAIVKSPKVSGFYIFQASLHEEARDLDAAVAVLEKAAGMFPDDERTKYYLGSLYDRRGETDRGLAMMESILAQNPENVDALNYVGYTWAVKGIRLADAEKLLRKALKLKPDNGYIQDSWGWYLFVRGRHQEAVVELEKAAKLRPNEATILEHLADAYLKNNLWEKAMASYREAAKYAEDDTAKSKIEGKLKNIQTDFAKDKSILEDRLPAGKATDGPHRSSP
jgi:tetratricopeptide (TPR) repeat protein